MVTDTSPTPTVLDTLAEWMKTNEAQVGLSYSPARSEFTGMAMWGQEAPDSPMAGAAAYSVGTTLHEAIEALLRDAGA